jgi:hypothetical protein
MKYDRGKKMHSIVPLKIPMKPRREPPMKPPVQNPSFPTSELRRFPFAHNAIVRNHAFRILLLLLQLNLLFLRGGCSDSLTLCTAGLLAYSVGQKPQRRPNPIRSASVTVETSNCASPIITRRQEVPCPV